jgi:hypothetical protein
VHLASRYLRDAQFTKKRQEVDTEPDFMAFRLFLAAFALGDDLIFFEELLDSLDEVLFG